MNNEELIELWDEHRPFIYKIALQYSGYAEMDDLMQEGYLGLYSAAIRFDQNAGGVISYLCSLLDPPADAPIH